MIEFSAIARGNIILVSHQTGHGSLEFVAESVLPKIPTDQNTKVTYNTDEYLIHVIIEYQNVYLCIAKESFGRRLPYAFLEEVRSRFNQSSLIGRTSTARSHELDRDFEFILKQLMEKFSNAKNDDSFSKLQNQVDDVKEIMTQNVEKVIQRGEGLDELVNKTQDLEESAVLFRNTSRKVKRTMRWKNIRMWIIISVVVLTIITVIALFASGVFDSK